MEIWRLGKRYRCTVYGLIFIGTVLSANVSGAATFYVAKDGNDSNTCSQAQSKSTPKLKINEAVKCLSAGDTLYIKSGTYTEWLNNVIPGGTSWTNPVTVAAYPGDTVILKPNAGSERALYLKGDSRKYIIWDGIDIDSINTNLEAIKITIGGGTYAHHIRIQNCEIKNSPDGSIMTGSGSDFNEFINLDMHDNALVLTPEGVYSTNVYIQSSNNLIEGSRIYSNGGRAIQIYNGYDGQANNNVIRKNKIYGNNVKTSESNKGAGLVFGSGTGNTAYNNLIWGNYNGIRLNRASKVYNNVIYSNTNIGIEIAANSNGAELKNNIIYQNGGSPIVDYSTNTISAANHVTDPMFVNAAAFDFRLQAGSPAIDAGITLTVVSDDYDGVSRPQGVGYDIGAYENYSDLQPPSPPTNLKAD